ncbi:MAG: hypothetical protein MI974_31265 [Chitinophagales bacterium]|nr:hypothetical protein [Chitinophagales bacterium]
MNLFEIFIADINRPKPRSLEREEIWKKLQPKKKYDDVRFRKYCSDLLKLVEGFLAQEVYESRKIEKSIDLIDAVGKKKLEKLYESSMRSARKAITQLKERSALFYLKNYEVENKSYELAENKHERIIKKNIDSLNYNLDVFYMSEKLRFYCSAIQYKLFTKQSSNTFFFEEILKHIRNDQELMKIPAISIYYKISLIQKEPENINSYYQLKTLLEQHALEFPQLEAMNIYVYAINYCIGHINKGDQKFLNEFFELHEDLIKKEIIFVNGELSPWNFKNIVAVALRLGKYSWTENFIHSYNDRLPEAFRDNAITFNLAQVYFHQKQHDKVLEQLRNVEYEDIAYNLGSKAMLISTYYEMDEVEPLYSLLESFRTYLNRHKHDISQNRRQNHANLIKFTKRLLRIMPGDNRSIEKLKIEINETKNVTGAKWLKEKIVELEG